MKNTRTKTRKPTKAKESVPSGALVPTKVAHPDEIPNRLIIQDGRIIDRITGKAPLVQLPNGTELNIITRAAFIQYMQVHMAARELAARNAA